MNISKNRVLISVVMITYGHEKYIHKAIEGVLMQQGGFDVEFIIADDHSPDNTEDIVKNIKNTHPKASCIKYTKHPVNKGMTQNFSWALKEATGKYIALCEGDDYWTDPLKLQKQVSFLEEHPDYSLVCGGFKSVNTVTGEEITAIKDVENSIDNTEQGFDITLERFFKQWLTKTLTLVYRTELYNPNDFKNYKYTRDVHLNYHLLKRGKGYYMKEVFGVYHIHQGGVFSAESNKNNVKNGYLVYKEIYLNDKNSFTKKAYINASRRYLEFFKSPDMPFKEKFYIVFNSLLYIRNKKDLKKTIKNIFKLF